MKEWFLSELRSVAAPAEAARFAIDLSDQSVSLVERRMKGLRERGSVRYGAPDFSDRIDHMRSIASRGRGEARVDIILPQELVLFRVETFPAEARGALRDEAWWRLDSITPFAPETLCYDVAQLNADAATGFLEVNIAVVPRDIVDEAISYARSWGFAPQRVTSMPTDGYPQGPLLLQASDARLETRSLRRTARHLGVAAMLLLMVGVWRGVAERQGVAASLETAQQKAEQEMEAVERIKRTTLAFVDDALSPVRRRRIERPALEWLDAIAEALPPGAVAEKIVMNGQLVRVEGVTDKPEGVLSALEAAPAFTDVRYAAPLKSVAGSRRRFAIEARLAPLKPDA